MCTCTVQGCLDRLRIAINSDPNGNLAVEAKKMLEPLFAKVPNEANPNQLSFLETTSEEKQLELF